MSQEFDTNLLRMICAELHALNGLSAAREMFGKSYFSLGLHEKTAVDQALNGMVIGNGRSLTPDFLKEVLTGTSQPQAPIGFHQGTPNS